ncbi:iron transporter [Streptomyces albidoflavus]|uniref:IucA/IucC family protein n=1 Tax=Streptomyces albidoflavus TaxID=1886 RepID=UPI00101E5268|nr:IucA/IucC family protein [Streptomyces albidoflavus]RZE06382.1 iron transporter [Streptomyces albidoflavus]RZE07701.1 iron transporter [Streptomyces albidoflavus]RZE14176.1 iron transporter [Streptomyces albidoflavus]
MNVTPAPDGGRHSSPRGTSATREIPADGATVPRQPGGVGTLRFPGGGTDLLEHPDARIAAEAAALESLLRCWVRETSPPAPTHGVLRIPLPASGTALLVPVRHWSLAGWHRFGPPVREDAPAGASPLLDVAAVAELLERESATEAHDGDLLERVGDSARRTALFLAERRARAQEEPDRFLAAEQSLVLGHPLHPTPKSREGLTEAESRAYSPELGGSFPLHWLAVDRSVLAQDSAWHEDGAPVPAEQLTARLAGPGLRLPEGTAALPVHPWQIRELRRRPEAAALLDAGALRDLGPCGEPWYPTSSVRTVYRPGAPAMLKLSLGLRITNSRRENLRKELARGAEVHRLLRTGLGARWQEAHPGFDIVRDPAWLAVDGPDGTPVTGLDVMIRDNPFTRDDDVTCVAGLVSPRPAGDARTGGRLGMRSRLGELVTRIAGREGRTRGAVSTEWFARYLKRVVAPVLWLDGHAGIALEAHQQNTLVLLDADGWPTGGRYRDNQGYYFRTSHRDALQARLPGAGEASDTFVADAVTDERFAYYLGINNILGLIGAFGSQRLADERLLLTVLRRFLAEEAARPGPVSPLPGLLLDSPVLRCKANLLTRLHGLDELVGPVDTQSVYVTIANPLHTAGA